MTVQYVCRVFLALVISVALLTTQATSQGGINDRDRSITQSKSVQKGNLLLTAVPSKFDMLMNVRKGQTQNGLVNLKRLLATCGYLSRHKPLTALFDNRLQAALRLYQRSFNLSVTGELDRPTLDILRVRKCRSKDSENGLARMIFAERRKRLSTYNFGAKIKIGSMNNTNGGRVDNTYNFGAKIKIGFMNNTNGGGADNTYNFGPKIKIGSMNNTNGGGADNTYNFGPKIKIGSMNNTNGGGADNTYNFGPKIKIGSMNNTNGGGADNTYNFGAKIKTGSINNTHGGGADNTYNFGAKIKIGSMNNTNGSGADNNSRIVIQSMNKLSRGGSGILIPSMNKPKVDDQLLTSASSKFDVLVNLNGDTKWKLRYFKIFLTTISYLPNLNQPEAQKWRHMDPKRMWVTTRNLTYAFRNFAESTFLSRDEIRSAVGSAFQSWSAVIQLDFQETDDFETANIKIEFTAGDHGDGSPFDGPLGVAAHVFAPEDGRFHLDSAEVWTVSMAATDHRFALDLESVALHEIGHLIGLDHSDVCRAVMFNSLEVRKLKRQLTEYEIEGAQALYGPRTSGQPHGEMIKLSDQEDTEDCPDFSFLSACIFAILCVLLIF